MTEDDRRAQEKAAPIRSADRVVAALRRLLGERNAATKDRPDPETEEE